MLQNRQILNNNYQPKRDLFQRNTYHKIPGHLLKKKKKGILGSLSNFVSLYECYQTHRNIFLQHICQGVFKGILGHLLHELTMIHNKYKAGSLGQSNPGQKLKQILGKAYHLRTLVSWGQTCVMEPLVILKVDKLLNTLKFVLRIWNTFPQGK